MTEIVAEVIEFKSGVRFCAVDNHRRKIGKSFDILYSASTKNELDKYFIEKGIK